MRGRRRWTPRLRAPRRRRGRKRQTSRQTRRRVPQQPVPWRVPRRVLQLRGAVRAHHRSRAGGRTAGDGGCCLPERLRTFEIIGTDHVPGYWLVSRGDCTSVPALHCRCEKGKDFSGGLPATCKRLASAAPGAARRIGCTPCSQARYPSKIALLHPRMVDCLSRVASSARSA